MIPLIIFAIIAFVLFSDAYLKPSIFKYITMIFSSIFGIIVGFNYYEMAADILIKKDFVPNMAQGLAFLLISAISFALFKAIGDYAIRSEIKFPEKAAKTVSYILSFVFAMIVTGGLFIFLALLPMSPKYPYPRFANMVVLTDTKGEISPAKFSLNLDGMITGLFSSVSAGSFSSPKSFGVIHNSFLNDCYLNRHQIKNAERPIKAVTGYQAIQIDMSDKNTVRKAHTNLKNEEGKDMPQMDGKELYIIKCPFNLRLVSNGGVCESGSNLELLPCQLRIICNTDYENGLKGKGVSVYPYGYIKNGKVARLNLITVTDIEKEKDDTVNSTMPVSVAFYVPKGQIPVAVAYKQNFIAQLPEQPSKESVSDEAEKN